MELHDNRTWLKAELSEVEAYECPAGEITVVCLGKPEEGRVNEDSAAFFYLGTDTVVLAVADGMGGGAKGEVASKIVIDTIKGALANLPEDSSHAGTRSALIEAIEIANQKVIDLGVGAGSTVALALVNPREFSTIHAGDSIAMVVGQKGKIKVQTVAHSPVGYAHEAGMLDNEQALFHPERHVVSNMVGMEALRVEVGLKQSFNPRDTLVLGTDGLFDNLSIAEIVDMIRTGPLEESAHEMAQRARQRMEHPTADEPSKPDDMVFLLYRPAPE
ncbi:MAG: serine/threonine-protein phosphatase [Planctomycetes bacterium]|nr:serine/threonine-protein phosphatase [Planctomycetota bacterium]